MAFQRATRTRSRVRTEDSRQSPLLESLQTLDLQGRDFQPPAVVGQARLPATTKNSPSIRRPESLQLPATLPKSVQALPLSGNDKRVNGLHRQQTNLGSVQNLQVDVAPLATSTEPTALNEHLSNLNALMAAVTTSPLALSAPKQTRNSGRNAGHSVRQQTAANPSSTAETPLNELLSALSRAEPRQQTETKRRRHERIKRTFD